MNRNLGYVMTLLLIFALTSCQDKNSAENAGERVDEIIDNIKDGDPPLKNKGAMEKAGEFIDE